MADKTIFVTFSIAVLYNVSFFIQMTLFTYNLKDLQLDGDGFSFGYLQTIFGICQFCGGPICGFICDKFGVKFGTFLAHISCSLLAISTYFSWDFRSLTAARTFALFLHGQQCHQTILAAFTAEGKERTSSFSRLGVTFGLGFMLGAAFGGISAKFLGYRHPLLIAAGITTISGLLVLKFVPNQRISEGKKYDSTLKNFTKSMKTLNYPLVLELFTVKTLSVVPMVLVTSILPVFLMEKFDLQPATNGLLSVYVGLSILFNNAFGVVWLRSKFDERKLLKFGCAASLLTYLGLSLFSELWHMLPIILGISLGITVTGTVVDSEMTSVVPNTEQGMVLGLSNTVNSVMRTVSPLAAAFLLGKLGFHWFGYVGMACIGITIFVIRRIDRKAEMLKRELRNENFKMSTHF